MSNVGFVGAVEAAGIVGLGEAQVWRLTRAGRFPSPVKIGRRTLWRRDEVIAWVERETAAYRAGKRARERARLPAKPGRRSHFVVPGSDICSVRLASNAGGMLSSESAPSHTEKQS